MNSGDINHLLAISDTPASLSTLDPTKVAEIAFALWGVYEYERAEQLFKLILEESHSTIENILQIAKCYFQSGRFGKSVDAMAHAIRRQKKPEAELHVQYAWTLERDNQFEQAREQLSKALEIDPSSARGVRLLAHLEKREGRYESAETLLTRHLKEYPSSFDWGLRYELASSLDRLGQFDEAWKQLQLAKSQLQPQAIPQLKVSYAIRHRQWEIAREITDVDLRNWQRDAESIGQPHNVAILAGFPRSGTTLLEQVLASNPKCVGTDESGIVNRQFSVPLLWEAATAFDAVVELRSFAAQSIDAGRQAYLKFSEALLGERIEDRLLVEKDPLATPDLCMFLRLFPEAKVLMPIRDPRDVIVSYFFTMVPLNWNSAPSIDVVQASRFYVDCMRHWLLWKTNLKQCWMETSYERMTVEPADCVRRVTDFLGLEWEPEMLDTKNRSDRAAVRTPTYDDITKPIDSRAVGRWKNYERHLAGSLEILNPFVEQFGYE